jgi:hypothetical protein
MLTTRLRFIEPQLASSVDQPQRGSTGFMKSNTMATAAKYCLTAGKRESSRAMDIIGATVIHLLSVPLPTSSANQQSLMVRQLSRTVTALLTSRLGLSPATAAPQHHPICV